MFGRDAPATVPPPAAPPAAPRPRPPAHQSRIFQPSTFASRKATAAAPPPGRRLVSLGRSEYVQRDWAGGIDGDVEVVEVELYYDRDRPGEKFAKFDGAGQRMLPLFDDSQQADQVTKLPPVKSGRLSRPAGGAYPDPLPDPEPRPV